MFARGRLCCRAGSAQFTYTPSADFVGTDRFTYSADDCTGNGLDVVYAGYNWTRTKCRTASATVEVIVRNPATLPVPLDNQILTVAEDTANWTESVMSREQISDAVMKANIAIVLTSLPSKGEMEIQCGE